MEGERPWNVGALPEKSDKYYEYSLNDVFVSLMLYRFSRFILVDIHKMVDLWNFESPLSLHYVTYQLLSA